MKNLTGIITGALIVLALGFLIIQNCECCETKCATENTPTPPEEETVVEGETKTEEVVEETPAVEDESTDVDADISEVVEDEIKSTEK